MIDTDTTTYDAFGCAAFRRSKDRHGELSNMTGGFPLAIALTPLAVTFQSPEGLYQTLKFPGDHDLQRLIAHQRSGMEAKRVAYASAVTPRPDWHTRRVPAMALTMAVKLEQHPQRFGRALRNTAIAPIVESSSRDAFWGAKPAGPSLAGVNALGKLLTRLRDLLLETENPQEAARRLADAARVHLRADSTSKEPLTILSKEI